MQNSDDWRIGINVQGNFKNESIYRKNGQVIDVLPNGTYGIEDKNCVLVVRMNSGVAGKLGDVVVFGADHFVTS